ncbi:YbhB/YbcL family Raf kinase inhibitor-like protein [Lactobacillus sp. ESL0791]|nr:YbhB/YbcL family Raf kinase inhibitor-like protein [Lactobacillus sp. ESL0791]MDF7639869.1 YbhB/YbcL family Raf kinase inhibitor-like protein [Lactobacillus sp. ESL0791]
MKKLIFTCSAIQANHTFNPINTKLGDNFSPTFTFSNLCPEAKSIAIILEDLSHPLIHNFTHWLIWNLPATQTIQGKITPGKHLPSLQAKQGIAYGWHKYAGPKPPLNHTHTYQFTVYALNCRLKLSSNTTKKKLLKVCQNKIIQSGKITATFTRKK